MKRIWVMLLLTLAGCGEEGPEVTGDTVVFIGDSITERWTLPPGVINAGVSGQTSRQMRNRFHRDVLRFGPDVVAILAGTNDIRFGNSLSTTSIAEMADLASKAGACVILGTLPPIYDWERWTRFSQSEGDVRLAIFNADIAALAQVNGYRLADYHEAFAAFGSEARALLADEVHPNQRGLDLMWGVVRPFVERCR